MSSQAPAAESLISGSDLACLRHALEAHFTGDQVGEALGLAGEAALGRGDLLGAERALQADGPTATFVRLFVLGAAVSVREAADAFAPLGLPAAVGMGLLVADAQQVRAALDLRPYAEVGGPDWWVVSDLGSDVRTGALDPEHVLGVGSAATTLAQSTIRRPVQRALDIGTGCGVQALHLSRHASSVVATDLSPRALRLAATTAAVNGMSWELREGSLLEPVAGQRFDLIVCNPPFIVGPGRGAANGGFTYRDSGLSGDEVCRRLVQGLPAHLVDGGTAQLLANWQVRADEDWRDRVASWISGCDAWVWQREVADPGEYVTLWLRDAGLGPGTDRWRQEYERWLDWFAEAGVIAVGMGLISLRRRDDGQGEVLAEDVPQPVEQPVGAHIDSFFDRTCWLRSHAGAKLREATLVPSQGLVLDNRSVLDSEGWHSAFSQLRQSEGMRWEVEADAAVAGFVAACDGRRTVAAITAALAQVYDLPTAELAEPLEPVLIDLVRRGILRPAELAT